MSKSNDMRPEAAATIHSHEVKARLSALNCNQWRGRGRPPPGGPPPGEYRKFR